MADRQRDLLSLISLRNLDKKRGSNKSKCNAYKHCNLYKLQVLITVTFSASDKARGTGHKPEPRKFCLNVRKNCCTFEWQSFGTNCQSESLSLETHRPTWTLSCAACCREPTLGRAPEVPFNPCGSGILPESTISSWLFSHVTAEGCEVLSNPHKHGGCTRATSEWFMENQTKQMSRLVLTAHSQQGLAGQK